MTRHLTFLVLVIGSLAGCSEEPPPRKVTEFLDNPILLEAAMVRCAQDRAGTRYEAECINAREAVDRIEAREEANRKVELEARSESVRRARRRAQEAAAEVRRRAERAARERKEAEYLAQFGVAPPEGGVPQGDPGNAPTRVVPPGEQQPSAPLTTNGSVVPATDGGNAPTTVPQQAAPGKDLEAIRDELRRRNGEGGN